MAASIRLPQASALNRLAVATQATSLTDLPASFRQVFRGRELTLKARRIESGLAPLDRLIGGGIVRGRISEIVGPLGAGKTSLAMAFAASVSRCEAVAWIEAPASLDPASIRAAGIEPSRLLWVSCANPHLPGRHMRTSAPEQDSLLERRRVRNKAIASLKSAEWVMAAGGFGLVVIDFGDEIRFIPQSAALRLARAAERIGAAIIVLAQRRLCGTFAVLSLELSRSAVCFNRIARASNATFDGYAITAHVTRNKLGGAGGTATWGATVEPLLSHAIPVLPRSNEPKEKPVRVAAGI